MSTFRLIVSTSTAFALLAPASALAQTAQPPTVVIQTAAPPVVVVQAPPPPAVVPQMLANPTVYADVQGDHSLLLEAFDGSRWQTACQVPCRVELPLNRKLRVQGPGIRRSNPLELEATPGQHVAIDAEAGGSTGSLVGGIVATSLGGSGVLVGFFVWFAGAVCGIDNGVCSGSSGLETAGLVTMGAGAAVMVGGIVLIATNPRSSLTQTVEGLAPDPAARPSASWLRVPTWRDPRLDAVSLPTAMVTPLFSRSF